MGGEGRAFGIHVLLGTQTLAGAYGLPRRTIDQMGVRIALQCSDADSRLILADDNPAARFLSRPGEAIYNGANGLVEGNSLFQVAWLPDEKRDTYLRQVSSMARERSYQPPHPQIVFEGNVPAELHNNRRLDELLLAHVWPTPTRGALAWLGEPVAIQPPTAATFHRRAGSHLLVLGRDEEAAVGMLTAAVLSLAAQYSPERVCLSLVDLNTYDAPWTQIPETLADVLPHQIQVFGRRHVAKVMGELADLVAQRLEKDAGVDPDLYLVVFGLQRARALRQEESFSSWASHKDAPPSPARRLATILEDGPEVGVHILVWCDTFASLTRAVDRRSIGEFGMRVGLAMSTDESVSLLDHPAAARLDRPHRAIFYDEERIGLLEKFRPYRVPEIEYIRTVGERLKARCG